MSLTLSHLDKIGNKIKELGMNNDTTKQRKATTDSPVSSKVLRFRKSERLLHWALAVPFLVCIATALVLVIHYNPDPSRPYRAVFAAAHRISAIAFFVLPILATIISKGDFRIHFYNIRQAWIWTLQDVKWLFLLGLSVINKNIHLPEQGKFNAAEKINFMYLMSTYSLYILSGLYIWVTDAALVAWVAHCLMAVLSFPLILGHIYMATINAKSRTGLSGMFSGYVDRHWAKHHYTAWFREHFEHKRAFADSARGEKLKPCAIPAHGGDDRTAKKPLRDLDVNRAV